MVCRCDTVVMYHTGSSSRVCVCVRSYYRFVLEPEPEFTEETGAVSGPFAQFDGLPLKPLLTVGMDPPESWLVESVDAIYDLDNICMDEVTLCCQSSL